MTNARSYTELDPYDRHHDAQRQLEFFLIYERRLVRAVNPLHVMLMHRRGHHRLVLITSVFNALDDRASCFLLRQTPVRTGLRTALNVIEIMRREYGVAFARIDATEPPSCLWQEPRSDLARNGVIKIYIYQVTGYGSHLYTDVAKTFKIIRTEGTFLPLLDADYF